MHDASVSHRGSIGTGSPQTFGHKELQKFTGGGVYRTVHLVVYCPGSQRMACLAESLVQAKILAHRLLGREPELVKKIYSVRFVK